MTLSAAHGKPMSRLTLYLCFFSLSIKHFLNALLVSHRFEGSKFAVLAAQGPMGNYAAINDAQSTILANAPIARTRFGGETGGNFGFPHSKSH